MNEEKHISRRQVIGGLATAVVAPALAASGGPHTGASAPVALSGIGRAAAIAYAREGADVAINYLPAEESDAQEVIGLIKKEGRKAIAIPGIIGILVQPLSHTGGLSRK